MRKQWFSNINGQWSVFSGVPKLTKNFAGISARELNNDGKDAINSNAEVDIGGGLGFTAEKSVTSACIYPVLQNNE